MAPQAQTQKTVTEPIYIKKKYINISITFKLG